jgi:hypothetical protein
MTPHLDALISLFVKKAKRERMRTLAARPGRRADLRHDLLHDTRSLDPAVLVRLGGRSTADAVARQLPGAQRAYCVSEVLGVDDQELPLAAALAAVVGRAEDSLVFALGTASAYLETHEGEQWLLVRQGAR